MPFVSCPALSQKPRNPENPGFWLRNGHVPGISGFLGFWLRTSVFRALFSRGGRQGGQRFFENSRGGSPPWRSENPKIFSPAAGFYIQNQWFYTFIHSPSAAGENFSHSGVSKHISTRKIDDLEGLLEGIWAPSARKSGGGRQGGPAKFQKCQGGQAPPCPPLQ